MERQPLPPSEASQGWFPRDWRPADWGRLLGLTSTFPAFAKVVISARGNQTTIRRELIMSGLVSEEELYCSLARELGIPFDPAVPKTTLLMSDGAMRKVLRKPGGPTMALVETPGASSAIYAAPEIIDLDRAIAVLEQYPDVKARMVMSTPSALRQAVIRRIRGALLEEATHGLFVRHPELSARIVASPFQGVLLGLAAIVVPASFLLRPVESLLALHLASSLFFLSCAGLRLVAAIGAQPPKIAATAREVQRDAPIYSVLVAMYHEADVAPELVSALSAIVWPRSKLEIKLVCEDDDHQTIAALRRQSLPPFFEIVEVPAAMPRTKPKALNFALQLCSGDVIAIYDAEDRPDPYQLVEAWTRFSTAGPDLGCLQAPLVISNGDQNALTALFALEYRALFHGLLPWLSRRGLIIPLGGTSNHFRRAALEQVLAWDSFNVTEDADLGLKLHRLGFRTEMISRPTQEDAPTDLRVWTRQRTRWFKGWMQTWLVHMRDPAALSRQIGRRSFVISQILFAGMFASSLLHIFLVVYLISIILKLYITESFSKTEYFMTAIDCMNLFVGYAGLIALARKVTDISELPRFWATAAKLPLYWLLMSVASWRAAWQLFRKPHLWEKTPHIPASAVVRPDGVYSANDGTSTSDGRRRR